MSDEPVYWNAAAHAEPTLEAVREACAKLGDPPLRWAAHCHPEDAPRVMTLMEPFGVRVHRSPAVKVGMIAFVEERADFNVPAGIPGVIVTTMRQLEEAVKR